MAKSFITRYFGACGLSGTPHIHAMAKVRVIFNMKLVAKDDWQIEAHYPGAEIRHIKGLKSKADVDDWLQGTRPYRLAQIAGLREMTTQSVTCFAADRVH